MSQRQRRLLAVVLALSGSLVLGRGLWIPAKAQLAQLLLARAWRQTTAAADDARNGTSDPSLRFRPWRTADTWPVARLELHSRKKGRLQSFVVLAGATGQALAFGPGLFHQTDSHIAIAGHRDTHFAALEHTMTGDSVSLELPGKEPRRYQVITTQVVHEDDPTSLEDPDGGERLSLVTCFPFGTLETRGPLRWLVQAVPVD